MTKESLLTAIRIVGNNAPSLSGDVEAAYALIWDIASAIEEVRERPTINETLDEIFSDGTHAARFPLGPGPRHRSWL